MPVLLLARGDQPSRTLLRHAIESRYGLGPPVLETLQLELKGRTHAKIGLFAMWMPLEGTVYLKFPNQMRWNFTVRPMGMMAQQYSFSFDGQVCRRGGSHVSLIDNPDGIASARARIWAMSGVLLTPLAEEFVELRSTGEHSFEALNHQTQASMLLHLNDDFTLQCTGTDCLNPSSGKQQHYELRVSEGQGMVSDLMLPRKLSILWDDQVNVELTPTAVQSNLALDESLFRLEAD